MSRDGRPLYEPFRQRRSLIDHLIDLHADGRLWHVAATLVGIFCFGFAVGHLMVTR